jgi:hypothetical protein
MRARTSSGSSESRGSSKLLIGLSAMDRST